MKKMLNIWHGMPVSAKASIMFAFSTFFLKGISFFTTPIFTRIMSPEHYGVITNYASWMSIIEVFALLGLTSAGVFNVGMNEYKETRDQYTSSLLGLTNCCTIVVFSLLYVVKHITGENFILPDELLTIMFLHLMIDPAQMFWITRQRYEFRYIAPTLVTIGSAILGQIFSIICIMNASGNYGTIKIWANEIATLLFAVPIYVLLLRKGRIFINFALWKEVLLFAFPLIPHYLAQHVMGSADRIMLTELVGKADTGIYGVVATIGTIAAIFWSAVNASLIPTTFESINRNELANLRRIINTLLSGYGIICIGVILIAPEVLTFLAPKEYSGGLYAIPPLVGVSFLNALYSVYANIEFYYKRAKNIAWATIIATTVNIIFNYILIPHYSYIGAAYATLLSNIVLILAHYHGYKKCNCKAYNDQFILLLTVGIIAFVVVSNLLYAFAFMRYIMTLAIIAFILLNYSKVISLVRHIKSKT